jgi:hypothetical protein
MDDTTPAGPYVRKRIVVTDLRLGQVVGDIQERVRLYAPTSSTRARPRGPRARGARLGDFDGTLLSPTAPRLIRVARRPLGRRARRVGADPWRARRRSRGLRAFAEALSAKQRALGAGPRAEANALALASAPSWWRRPAAGLFGALLAAHKAMGAVALAHAEAARLGRRSAGVLGRLRGS